MQTNVSGGGLRTVLAETIGLLDRGRVGVALEQFIRQATQDCIDRPGDDRARTVLLMIDVKPVAETHGELISCEGARGKAKVRLRLPDRESSELDFGVRKGGHLVFSEHSPANHKQATFLDENESEDDV